MINNTRSKHKIFLQRWKVGDLRYLYVIKAWARMDNEILFK